MNPPPLETFTLYTKHGIQQPTNDNVGVHLIANVYDVNVSFLEKMDANLSCLENIVNKLDLHVVSKTGFQFEPVGYTYAFVLSESHFTIHTYPEYNSCYIDIFCCNKDFNSEDAIELLSNTFNTTHISYQTIKR
jgi:S-adenosylmethionine decarboxylase proenzyme